MRRPVLKTAVMLSIALLAVGLGSYLLLLTALPGRWILAAASDALGLEVNAESLSVGWMGRTSVRNAKVTMPLSHEEVLSAAQIELSHRALPWLLLTRSAGLSTVRIESPNLHVHRDENGRWNVHDVWTRVNAGREPDRRPRRKTAIPKIEIRNATIRVADANGTIETIGPLDFQGQPQDRSLWTFALQTGSETKARGQVAQGLDWTHRIGFDLTELSPLLRALQGPEVAPLRVAGRWEGRVTGNTLTGLLELDPLHVGGVTLQGKIEVETQPDGVVLHPTTLLVSEPSLIGAPMRFTTGSVYLDARGIKAKQLGLQANGLTASLDGHWSRDTHLGAVTGSWLAGSPGGKAEGQGICEITWQSPPAGRKEAEMKLTANVETALGDGSVTARILGTGRTWKDSNWEVSVPKLAWNSGSRQLDVTDAEARVALNWPDLQLTALRRPNAQELRADAQFHSATGQWSAQIDALGLRPEPWAGQPLDIHFSGAGDRDKVAISELNVTQGERRIVAKGELSLSNRTVRAVHVSAQWPVAGQNAATAATPGTPGR
jgi:hypothetical protein